MQLPIVVLGKSGAVSSFIGSAGNWRKSSFSASDQCVEVCFVGEVVRVRNSRDRSKPPLAFAMPEWASFTAALRNGEFGPTTDSTDHR